MLVSGGSEENVTYRREAPKNVYSATTAIISTATADAVVQEYEVASARDCEEFSVCSV